MAALTRETLKSFIDTRANTLFQIALKSPQPNPFAVVFYQVLTSRPLTNDPLSMRLNSTFVILIFMNCGTVVPLVDQLHGNEFDFNGFD